MNARDNASRTQAPTEWVDVSDELEASRSRALLLTSAEQIPFAEPSAIVAVQAVLQHGTCYGRWQTPRRWFTTATPVKLDVDLKARIVAQLADDGMRQLALQAGNAALLDRAVLTLARYLVVLRMGPAGMGRKGGGASLDPRTVSEIAYFVGPALIGVAVARWLQAEHRPTGAEGFLSTVRAEDLAALKPSIRRLVLAEVRRMVFLDERDCWRDLPSVGDENSSTTPVAGKALESEREPTLDPHLPLPDDYVSDMGQRSIWLIESLAPNLLLLAQEIRLIWEATADGRSARSIEHSRRPKVAKLFEGWDWRDANGSPILKPPFDIHLSKNGSKGKPLSTAASWPPRNLAEFLGLLANVQLAHLFVVCMSTGARKAETLDLQRTCLEYAKDGLPYASGRTFKLVQRHDGELRDWVLPDLAVTAIEQQCRLVRVVEAIGPQKPGPRGRARDAEPLHLWAQLSTAGNHDRCLPLLYLDKALRSYARALGMDERPSGQWLRPHRFRKTVARLAALALTQAPKVLMNVFGHKSIEMTLYYILTDKTLQAEIEQVGRELRVMRAAETVEALVAAEDAGNAGVELGGYGGPAALTIDRAVKVQRERVHQRGEQWGADSVRELAEILTLQGKAWEVVREGVVCTKLPGTESGPCNKSKGRPEPSQCQSNCNHRLEESFLREDVDASIEYSVREFEVALQADDELMQAMWAGQIRAHLPRFADLQEKWKLNPTVKRVLVASNDEQSEVAA